MKKILEKRNILCIDLKSFFASAECIERGLNPFSYPLVVANKNQGSGAITLAVTPFLKNMGVKSRGRLYEIPNSIKYEIVNPRMNLYIEKSKEVIGIYLDFVSENDLYIYSIDECFLDVTDYLKLYKKKDTEIAKDILNKIKEKTGLTATCGIGSNMLIAKIAMDIEAKKNTNNIAKWDDYDIQTKMWEITPLSQMWGIGSRMEKRLNKLGIYKVGDLAKTDINYLKDVFGIIGIELWNHANGIDSSLIKDHKTIAKDESFSHSQILFKDYNETNIKIIIEEMTDVIVSRLKKSNKQTKCIGLGIGYSKELNDGFFHNIKLDIATDDYDEILKYLMIIFDRFYVFFPIRKVSINCSALQRKTIEQLNLFESNNISSQKDSISSTISDIKNKFGKNSLLKATSLLSDSTAIERNKKIGGHSA